MKVLELVQKLNKLIELDSSTGDYELEWLDDNELWPVGQITIEDGKIILMYSDNGN